MDNADAKEIFFEYYGNKYYMWHEGTLEAYTACNISKEQEVIWKNELAQALSKFQFKDNQVFYRGLTLIELYQDYNLLEKRIDLLRKKYNKADCYINIIIAEKLNETLGKLKCPLGVMDSTRKFINEILSNVLEKEIILTKQSLLLLKNCGITDVQVYIRDRATDLVAKITL